MSTPFIALMLVLAGILVWALALRYSLRRQTKELRGRKQAYEARLRDFHARQAAAPEPNGPGEARFVELLSTLGKPGERAGLGGAMLVMTHDPHSPGGARMRLFREITQTPAKSER